LVGASKGSSRFLTRHHSAVGGAALLRVKDLRRAWLVFARYAERLPILVLQLSIRWQLKTLALGVHPDVSLDKGLRTALVTSSSRRVIDTVAVNLDVHHLFDFASAEVR